ncbi:MAG: TetR/AcrR family transcriptional regulator [Planctomycetes bacterium]|nr:TetR/AcrR family transcriptional regulator [Planctomycetota bacterium]
MSTRDKLLKIGREEFLQKGYKDASLRAIGKKSGFTLGAFYGYYAGKEALFEDIVREPALELRRHFATSFANFEALPPAEQPLAMAAATDDGVQEMLDIIYRDVDVFKLIFFKSAGTAYEHYLETIIDEETRSTRRFLRNLKRLGYRFTVDDELVHMLASAVITGLVQVVDHDMNRKKAGKYAAQLRTFYTAGWHRLLGITDTTHAQRHKATAAPGRSTTRSSRLPSMRRTR